MKKFKSIVLFLVCSSLFFCENNTNGYQLKLKLDCVIQQNDSIRVFYTTDGTINFVEEQAVWKKIKGSNKNQEVTIEIPIKAKPNQLRIDFGNNIKNQEIVLNKICVSYSGSNFEAKGEEIYWSFRPDENNTILDKKNGILRRKDSTQINGPSLYPKGEKLTEQLNLLYKKQANAK